jgi:hypothetical protein
MREIAGCEYPYTTTRLQGRRRCKTGGCTPRGGGVGYVPPYFMTRSPESSVSEYPYVGGISSPSTVTGSQRYCCRSQSGSVNPHVSTA